MPSADKSHCAEWNLQLSNFFTSTNIFKKMLYTSEVYLILFTLNWIKSVVLIFKVFIFQQIFHYWNTSSARILLVVAHLLVTVSTNSELQQAAMTTFLLRITKLMQGYESFKSEDDKYYPIQVNNIYQFSKTFSRRCNTFVFLIISFTASTLSQGWHIYRLWITNLECSQEIIFLFQLHKYDCFKFCTIYFWASHVVQYNRAHNADCMES